MTGHFCGKALWRVEQNGVLKEEVLRLFTTEIRINGTLIAHIYGRNVCPCSGMNPVRTVPKKHRCKYEYEYSELETRKVRSGIIKHDREDSLRKLITAILNDVEKQEKKTC